jgi:hypothetical protein
MTVRSADFESLPSTQGFYDSVAYNWREDAIADALGHTSGIEKLTKSLTSAFPGCSRTTIRECFGQSFHVRILQRRCPLGGVKQRPISSTK